MPKRTYVRGHRSRISVIISGMPSAGKTTAADIIAKKFRLSHLAGGDMLKQMAVDRGYKPSGSDWWDTTEGMRFLLERSHNPDFDREVDRRLIERVKRGGVVVTSYPIPWIYEDGLKLWFDASQKTRAKRLAGRDSIPFSSALRTIRQRDSQNRNLYRKLYGIRFGQDLSVFNFKIDTEDISADEVARLSAELVSNYKRSRKGSGK